MTTPTTTDTARTVADRAPARIQPDSRPVVLAATWLVAGLALVSFILGVPGLVAVAEWAGLPPVLRWGVPLMLDAGLVVMALVATVRRARGESAKFAWTVLTALTVASMGVQVAHVAAAPGEGWQVAVGMALAASFPAVVFASTHSLLDLAVAPAPARKVRRTPARKPAAATAAKKVTNVKTAAATANSKPASALATQAPVGQLVAVKPSSPRTKAADVDVSEFVRLRADGLSYARLGEALGISTSAAKRLGARLATEQEQQDQQAA